MDVLTYTSPEDLRDRIPDSDIVELTTDGSDEPRDREVFLERATSMAGGGDVQNPSPAEAKVARVLRQSLLHGEGRVNSRVGATYDLPATAPDGTVPSEIEDAVLVLAEGRMRNMRPRRTRRANDTSDIERRVQETESWLKDVAKGNAIIAMLNEDATEQKQRLGAESGSGRRSRRKFSVGW